MRYCAHRSMSLLLLAGFPECCTPKSPPPLSCSSELASCTFSILLPLVCFFLLLLSSSSYFCFRTLLSSEPEDVFSLLSQKLDWLACAIRRLLYVFRVVRVVRVFRQVVRVVRRVVWVFQVVRVVRRVVRVVQVVRQVVWVVRVVQVVRVVRVLYWYHTTGLLYWKYYILCPSIWTFLPD